MPDVISRQEALSKGLKRYYTGEPCAKGHVAERQVSNFTCFACANEAARARNAARPEKNRARVRSWQDSNPEKVRAQAERFRNLNRDKLRAAGLDYWKRNPERFRHNCAKRYASKTRATPTWVDMAAIAAMYAEAVRVSTETGVPHEVDHIVPLRNKRVCGLHVPWNLRVVESSENRRKGNRLLSELVAMA